MRMRNAEYATRPWRIIRIAPDFKLLDAWDTTVQGSLGEFDTFLETVNTLDPADQKRLGCAFHNGCLVRLRRPSPSHPQFARRWSIFSTASSLTLVTWLANSPGATITLHNGPQSFRRADQFAGLAGVGDCRGLLPYRRDRIAFAHPSCSSDGPVPATRRNFAGCCLLLKEKWGNWQTSGRRFPQHGCKGLLAYRAEVG